MDHTIQPMVQLLDEDAWERGELLPIGRHVPVDEWLGQLRVWEMRLSLPPLSRIASGPYDNGHILVATGDVRLAFAVPPAALPLLRDWLTEREYGELTRRRGR